MSQGTKTAIIVAAIAAVLCGVVCISAYLIGQYIFSRSVATQPEQAAKIGREIADYTLPPGYTELGAMNLLGVKWVVIGKRDQDSMVLMLMQFPPNSATSEEEMRQSMEQALAQQGQRQGANFRVVGTRQAVIKGKPVIFTVSEGESASGEAMRQMTGVFPGQGGMAMLMIMGSISSWDDTTLDSFLSSIR